MSNPCDDTVSNPGVCDIRTNSGPEQQMLSLFLGGTKNNNKQGKSKRIYQNFVLVAAAVLAIILIYLHFFTKVYVLPYAAIGGGIFLLFIRDRFFKVEGLNLSAHLLKKAKKSKVS